MHRKRFQLHTSITFETRRICAKKNSIVKQQIAGGWRTESIAVSSIFDQPFGGNAVIDAEYCTTHTRQINHGQLA